MDPQTINYFSRLIEDTAELVAALQKWDLRIQEAYDRRIDANLPTDDEFAAIPALSHLTVARLGALLGIRNAVMTTLLVSGREGWNDLFEVIS